MLARTIPALLLTMMLAACADLVDTNDGPAFEGARNFFSPATTVYCGDCGQGRTGFGRSGHTSHVNGAGHTNHGHGERHKHGHSHRGDESRGH